MWRLFFLIAAVTAQIPSLGFCPDYQPMANFNMNRFLGTWYEAERYFTVSELGSRCVTTKYESTPEGRILVSNEITNAMTGMKRVLDGHLQMIGREGEGRMIVKYATLPVPYDTEFSVLDTDYDTYAVMWSCSGIGPVHIQNAWVLTRERLAPQMVMQKAYTALEKCKVSRTFFVKTNQEDCYILPDPAAYSEYKEAGIEVSGKHASLVPVSAATEAEPVVEKKVEAEVKSEVPEVKSAVPEAIKEPQLVPELKAAETMAMEEKTEMPEQTTEVKKEMPEIKEEAPKEKDLPVKPIQ
ncbi:Apolipoprotein D [Papilio machaon]|uniref:Apolipoprotein D n=1 Tax=Papilio machaon TaxID=76193 RepID=A0A194QVB0_PAPMA|nr:Apolipoprotein D [Papilio machaon]